MHMQHPAGCALSLSGPLVKGLRYNASALNQSVADAFHSLSLALSLSIYLSRALFRSLSLSLSPFFWIRRPACTKISGSYPDYLWQSGWQKEGNPCQPIPRNSVGSATEATA